MILPPPYFERVRAAAERRWDQLDADPELAGPWRQLFAQVQSPRHVLSELLQNADDAGATEASVQLDEDGFLFGHNGSDFVEEHFQSLCRFAYSNKRTLHTIGFRGIGFKSTFSLGNTVELRSPTLSVAFHRQRFTQPHWIDGSNPKDGWTYIRVQIRDTGRRSEIEKNLRDWVESPVSLLFFRHLRKLSVGSTELDWRSAGPGPAPGSDWVALSAKPDEWFLVVRSGELPFPEDARAEIAQERQIAAEGEVEFPPCKVEIVLGGQGRLYVVLATGVTTTLPFACNAPFIQDPARMKIKDPETSPTNRWLLKQVGRLAALAMLGWLKDDSSSLACRADAYRLFPDVNRSDNSLEGTCGAIVEEAFETAVEGTRYLLTNSGRLEPAGGCVILPDEMIGIWPTEQAAAFLDSQGRQALSPLVSNRDRDKLLHWHLVGSISIDDVLQTLTSRPLPVPSRWEQLHRLWSVIAPKITGYWCKWDRSQLRIVPAQGQDTLCAASDVVRLGEGRLLQSDSDWEFLSDHLLVLDPNWPRYLAKRRRETQGEDEPPANGRAVEAAYGVLKAIGLEETSDHSKILDQVASQYFEGPAPTRAACVRLAQIAAKLGATVGASFRYVTRDGSLRRTCEAVVYDPHGRAEDLLLPGWGEAHLLHSEYSDSPTSCTDNEWREWASSERSGLQAFLPLPQVRMPFRSRHSLSAELVRRGGSDGVAAPYQSRPFVLEDWDFDPDHWQHWNALSEEEPGVFARVLALLLDQPASRWRTATTARAYQEASTGSRKQVTQASIVPGWVLKFRDLPCLPDTRGVYRKPAELLRRTETTEALLDVEPFLHARLDTEALRPLLRLLGVGEQPTGPATLLARLRALAMADRPPVSEVDRWYHRLDQMFDACSTESRDAIRQALLTEPLALTESLEWACGSRVFQSAADDAPGAPVILSSARSLALWSRIGVPERPTADLALDWVRGLPSGCRLGGPDLVRVRALLGRYPQRVWTETGHWLNLADEWVPTNVLAYAVTMAGLVTWSHLFPHILSATADLRRLTAEAASCVEFSSLKSLAHHLEERPAPDLRFAGTELPAPWLRQFGYDLQRFRHDDPEEQEQVRGCARELSATVCRVVPTIPVAPYLDGKPAGVPSTTDVLWHGTTLYVQNLSTARLARVVPERIGKSIGNPEVAAALHYCFERSPEQVTAYLNENFPLEEGAMLEPEPALATPEHVAGPVPGSGQPPGPGEPGPDPPGEEPGENQATASPDVASGDNGVDPEAALGSSRPISSGNPPRPRPASPNLIARFARTQGFHPNGGDGYAHPRGDRLVRVAEEPFPWEWRTAAGERRRSYWPKEHCLDNQPLQLPSELWELMEQDPERYALLLTDPDDGPVEFGGSVLREMKANGRLTLYPAAYRLVVGQQEQ